MRVVVTGGAGFIGRAIVDRLAARGDEVTALVRDPRTAGFLDRAQVTLVSSDLADAAAMTDHMRGADAVVHGAGMYRVGIREEERAPMWDANVGTTQRVLDAAITAGVPRIVYISTVNIFGNTRGRIADESYQRDSTQGFLTYYDETKYRAHEEAERRIAAGAPIVIVQPAAVYGPHDHSAAGGQLRRAYRGRLRFTGFPSLGLSWVHVDDVAAGVLAALDRGRVGEAYILAADRWTLGEAIALAARLGGKRPPRLVFPTAVLRVMAPLSRLVGGLPGLPPNVDEVIASSEGVTYYSSSEKAQRELGFSPRPLEKGIIDSWGPAADSASAA